MPAKISVDMKKHFLIGALQIDHSLYDAKYSKGFCYEELGDFQKAYDVWCEIADELKTEGYEIEAKLPMELAEKCREKLM